MNIRDKKIKTEIDNIVRAALTKGHLPTSDEVIGLLGQYITKSNLSMPTYEFKNIYENFSLDIINKAKSDVANDLNIVYTSIVELYNEAERQVNKFDAEKKKYDYKLNQLQAELLNMVSKYSANGYTDSNIETFADMQNVDLTNTTCNIDLNNQEATLKELSDSPITAFKSITAKFSETAQANGNIMDYIYKQGVYWQSIIAKQSQSTTTAEITVELDSIRSANKIELNFPLIKPAALKVYISKDAGEWIQEYAGLIQNKAIVNTTTPFKYIKIVMTKEEADKFADSKYLYYFIIDTIRVLQVNYARESEFISSPIKFSNNVSRVSISKDSVEPNSTNIDFYVSLNTPQRDWIPITPLNATGQDDAKVVNFNTIEVNKMMDIRLQDGISTEAQELKNLAVNGQKLYSLADINGVEIIKGSLYKGMDAWRCDSINRSIAGATDKTVFLSNQSEVVTKYNSLLFGKPSLIINNQKFTMPTVLKFTTTLECPDVDQIIKAPIVSNQPVTIYLNGIMLYKGSPSGYIPITYPFKARKNILEVIVNVNSSDISNGFDATVSTDLNIDMYSVCSYVYADSEPLKETSVFNLRYNTNNQKDVYALRKTNEGYSIIVKDDDLKISYRFVYDYIIEKVDELVVKAVLKRHYEAVNITPKLKGYEIRIV